VVLVPTHLLAEDFGAASSFKLFDLQVCALVCGADSGVTNLLA